MQGCNKKAMLMYFIHLNNPEKTQYTIEEVKGELREELAEILYKREPEENKLALIMQMVKYSQINTINELMNFAIESGIQNIIRKYQYILIKIIEEKRINEYKRISKSN